MATAAGPVPAPPVGRSTVLVHEDVDAERLLAGLAALEPRAPTTPRRTRLVTGRRRTIVIAVLGVLIAAAVAVLGVTGVNRLLDSRQGRIVDLGAGRSVVYLPNTPAGLLVVADQRGSLSELVVLAVAASGRGGYVIVVPVGLKSALAGTDEPRPLSEAYRDGGVDGVREAAEALLGVTFTHVEAVDEASLVGLLQPYAPLTVESSSAVMVEGATPTAPPVSLFAAGRLQLDAKNAARFLATTSVADTQLEHTARLVPFWQALMARVLETSGGESTATSAASTTVVLTGTNAVPEASRPTSSEPDAPETIAGYIAAVGSGPFAVTQLPLVLRPTSDNVEAYDTDDTYLRLLMAQALPGAVSSASTGARVRLVNPFRDQSLMTAVAGQLLSLGYNLVMASESTAAPPARTTVEYLEAKADAERSAAYLVSDVLKLGIATPTSTDLQGVDLTVTIGQDYADAARTSTTTTIAGDHTAETGPADSGTAPPTPTPAPSATGP